MTCCSWASSPSIHADLKICQEIVSHYMSIFHIVDLERAEPLKNVQGNGRGIHLAMLDGRIHMFMHG